MQKVGSVNRMLIAPCIMENQKTRQEQDNSQELLQQLVSIRIKGFSVLDIPNWQKQDSNLGPSDRKARAVFLIFIEGWEVG